MITTSFARPRASASSLARLASMSFTVNMVAPLSCRHPRGAAEDGHAAGAVEGLGHRVLVLGLHRVGPDVVAGQQAVTALIAEAVGYCTLSRLLTRLALDGCQPAAFSSLLASHAEGLFF